MILLKFRHKNLEALYNEDKSKGLPSVAVSKLKRVLAALEFADDISSIATMPGWRLHSLTGDRKGEYSITITANWRLTFRVDGNLVTEIDFQDYH